MAKKYGKKVWQKSMAKKYGKKVWQKSMAKNISITFILFFK
jgi:hypothetical protein